MEKLCTVRKKKKKRLGTDCGTDHELIIAFRLKYLAKLIQLCKV